MEILIPHLLHISYSNVVLGNYKSRKEKWQCGQNLDLNPTYVNMRPIEISQCAQFIRVNYCLIFHNRHLKLALKIFGQTTVICNFKKI